VGERRHVDTFHIAVHADHGRHAGGQMQIGCVVLDGERQQLRNIDGH
jgi:hypothetical protein